MKYSNVEYIHAHEINIKTHGSDFEREVMRGERERERERNPLH